MAPGEQLSFGIQTAMPRPGDVAPMLATPALGPFDEADTLFEPAWGGQRVLVFVEAGDQTGPGMRALRIQDAAHADLAPVLPELGGLPTSLAARTAVLDGELVAVDGAGRPDPAALAGRLQGNPGRPVVLVALDLLFLDGQWLMNRPLEARLNALARIVTADQALLIPPRVAGEGRALHAAVTQQGVAGVLARRRTSPYLPGVRSTLWRFIAAGAPGDVPAGEDHETAATADQAIGERGLPRLSVALRLPLLPPDR